MVLRQRQAFPTERSCYHTHRLVYHEPQTRYLLPLMHNSGKHRLKVTDGRASHISFNFFFRPKLSTLILNAAFDICYILLHIS